MFIADDVKDKVPMMLERTPGTMTDLLGIKYVHYAKDKVIAEMPVQASTKQPWGLLHGGASLALAESLASVGGWLNVDDSHNVVGVELNANHVRAMREGKVIGTATPLHIGRRSQVWETRITTEDGKLVSIGRCTLMVVNRLVKE